eukprot:Em0003g836a
MKVPHKGQIMPPCDARHCAFDPIDDPLDHPVHSFFLGHSRYVYYTFINAYTGDEAKDDQRLCVVEHKAIRCLCQGLVQQHCCRLRPTWQLESFMKCRDTFWMESFNHQLLTYLPKRIHFHTNTFKMRMNLAVIDWMSIIEVFICRRLHMNTSMILICICTFEEDDAIDELMSPDDSTLLDGEYVDSESEEYQEDDDNDA